MATSNKHAASIWNQTTIPVVYRRGGAEPLMIKLPYAPNNGEWLRNDQRRKPEWISQFKCWNTPKSWFENVVRRLLIRFSRVYVIQPFRVQEKCAPACWNATGIECECSCMGAHHGSGNPSGKWHVISETFAVQWQNRQLACRLFEQPHDNEV
jgi:hypothetical protein